MLGDMLVFLIRDVASCQRVLNLPVLCSFHIDARATMTYTHRLNRG